MSEPTAYIFAHPGHEFRLLQTLVSTPSTLHIFTQGSRAATSTDRIIASSNLAHELGVTCGEIFGKATDRDFYRAILAKDVDFFQGLVTQLATSFALHNVTRVVLDSWQNYNPVHDLTHLCGRLAVQLHSQRTGQSLPVFDYPVVFGNLTATPVGPVASNRSLDDSQVAIKLAAIQSYPDIADDARTLIEIDGDQALRHETLHHLLPLEDLFPAQPPFYEEYGRLRVTTGAYAQVITWSHVNSIVLALLKQNSSTAKDVVPCVS